MFICTYVQVFAIVPSSCFSKYCYESCMISYRMFLIWSVPVVFTSTGGLVHHDDYAILVLNCFCYYDSHLYSSILYLLYLHYNH